MYPEALSRFLLTKTFYQKIPMRLCQKPHYQSRPWVHRLRLFHGSLASNYLNKSSRPEFRTAIFLYLDQSSDLLDELNALITYEDARLSLRTTAHEVVAALSSSLSIDSSDAGDTVDDSLV